jgi:type II secretory pathway component PulK
MAFLQPSKTRANEGRESGIALFMVVASMTILALIVTEFTYIAQVNSRMAFDSLDQVKAHYLAKSGLKLSLIRIRAYQNLKALAKTAGGDAGSSMIPKGLLEKIWSFPFFYPIPLDVPGLAPSEKDQIKEFTKNAAIEGRFSALIESESSKYNLNSILAPFAAISSPTPTSTSPASGGAATGGGPNDQARTTSPTSTPLPTFNPMEAQKSLASYITQILNNKIETDEDFSAEYRDLKVDEFVDNLISWADATHERQSAPNSSFHPKGGPFYSLSELRMIEPMDDRLYEVLAPHFTVSAVPGLNVNTVKDTTLKAFFPQMTDEELKEFFKFRDSAEQDNSFKNEDAFFSYLKSNVAAFRGSDREIETLKEEFRKRNIRIVTDETHFRITVQATVNQATRLLQADVMVVPPKSASSRQQGQGMPPTDQAPAPLTDSGLRITSMRIL